MFARGFQHGSRHFKSFSRMQCHMSFCQFSMLNKQVMMVQLAQNKLTSTSMLLQQIRVNSLLLNEEAELGVSANSEDLGKYHLTN